jgi:hypothetical protein
MRCGNAHDRTLADAVATRTTRLRGASWPLVRSYLGVTNSFAIA